MLCETEIVCVLWKQIGIGTDHHLLVLSHKVLK